MPGFPARLFVGQFELDLKKDLPFDLPVANYGYGKWLQFKMHGSPQLTCDGVGIFYFAAFSVELSPPNDWSFFIKTTAPPPPRSKRTTMLTITGFIEQPPPRVGHQPWT